MLTKKQVREYAKMLNPIDDPMFCKMAEDREFCEEILRVILSDNELIITENIPQWPGKNLQGRSVILDAKCITKYGKHINVEIQKSDEDNHQKRVRYNGSILTTNITDTGTKFELIPDVYIVFISKFDIFKGNLPLYHVDRVVRETNKVVENGLSEIYVNATIDDGSNISELMKVFTKDDAYSELYPKTSEIKQRYKETEGGIQTMCEIMEIVKEDGRIEGRAEGRAEGEINKAKKIASDMKKKGLELSLISELTGLTEDEILSL